MLNFCSASVAVLVRLAYIKDFDNPDFLYATSHIAIRSAPEAGLAIIAGSLPTLRPLYTQICTAFGISTSGPSEKTPKLTHWTAGLSGGSKKSTHFGFSRSFGKESRTRTDEDGEPYGMGDLQPMRLKDEEMVEMVEDHVSEQSDNGFKAWSIRAGAGTEKGGQPGTITMQSEIHQHVGRRG